MRPTDAEIAEAWIEHWRGYEMTGEFAPYSTGQWVDLPQLDPELCWRVIFHVLDRVHVIPDDPFFQVLAAGPLEQLLAHWGADFIDRVEERAANDSRFKQLLGGVWRNTISADVWKRLEACRAEPW